MPIWFGLRDSVQNAADGHGSSDFRSVAWQIGEQYRPLGPNGLYCHAVHDLDLFRSRVKLAATLARRSAGWSICAHLSEYGASGFLG